MGKGRKARNKQRKAEARAQSANSGKRQAYAKMRGRLGEKQKIKMRGAWHPKGPARNENHEAPVEPERVLSHYDGLGRPVYRETGRPSQGGGGFGRLYMQSSITISLLEDTSPGRMYPSF